MPTKKVLSKKGATTVVTATEQHIEVPAGSHRFVVKQTAEEQKHVFHLRHPETEVSIIGLISVSKNEAPSLETQVIHHSPYTKAETVIKTLSRDKAAPRYRGMIRIEPGSHNCESYLTHNSLLIGEKAQSWSTPSLEILNNEVKCSHAATVRTITPADTFYLQSRGLDAKAAEKVLIEAFTSDVQD